MQNLKEVIQAVGKGIENPNNVFYFEKFENESYLCGTNGEFTIIKKIDYDFPSCSIKAKEFIELIKSIEEDEINIKLENNCIEIDTDTTKTVFKCSDKKIIDKFKICEKWFDLPSDFKHKLSIVSKSASDSNNIQDGLLRYVYIYENYIASCNRYLASYAELDGKILYKMFIKKSNCNFLINSNITKYSVIDDLLEFYDESGLIYIIHTLLQEEKFPWKITKSDWSEEWNNVYHTTPYGIMESTGLHFKFENNKSVLSSLNRASLFSDDNGYIEFAAEGLLANVRGVGKYGKSINKLNLTQPVKSKIIAKFNAELLKKAILSDSDVKYSNNMLSFTDSDNVFHVILSKY